MKVKSESEVTQSCPTLCDPTDGSLPGSSVHGIFQARVLEWVAIAFSDGITNLFLFNTENIWKYQCMHALWFFKSIQLLVDICTVPMCGYDE